MSHTQIHPGLRKASFHALMQLCTYTALQTTYHWESEDATYLVTEPNKYYADGRANTLRISPDS